MAQLKEHKVLCSNATIFQLNFYTDVLFINPLVHAQIYCGSFRETYKIFSQKELRLQYLCHFG